MSEIGRLKSELLPLASSTDAGFESQENSPAVMRIKELAQKLEALNPSPQPARHPTALNGRWELLYSSFGLERQTTLRRISFATLPREAKIVVSGVYQMVDADTQRYDNHVAFTCEDGTTGVHVTRGRFVPTADSNQRLDISFFSNAAQPSSPDVSGEKFRASLGLAPDDTLEAPLAFNGWSDVTYLDDDTRLMRGNAGNLYVLTRIGAI